MQSHHPPKPAIYRYFICNPSCCYLHRVFQVSEEKGDGEGEKGRARTLEVEHTTAALEVEVETASVNGTMAEPLLFEVPVVDDIHVVRCSSC